MNIACIIFYPITFQLFKQWIITKARNFTKQYMKEKSLNDFKKLSKTIKVSTWVLDTLTYYAGLKKKFISGWNMKEAEKQKNQHHHQHHHHHRHHLNHFCIVRVRDKYITVCNNSYIPLVIRMQILLMEKSYMSCCFSSFFARKQRFQGINAVYTK